MKRSILITGATGKIGKVFVKHFLNNGDEVIALAKTKTKLKKLKTELNPFGDDLKIITLDLMKKGSEKELIQSLNLMGVQPNCLINNARSIKNLKINENGYLSDQLIMNEFKLGVIVPYKLVMALIKADNTSIERVVNISSIYGVVAPNLTIYKNPEIESPIHYGLAKAALIQLTKELAVRLSKNNVLVNCIAYGGVEGRANDEFKSKYSRLCPSGKMLSEDQLAKPIEILLSEGSEGINGHVLMVDGGWTIW